MRVGDLVRYRNHVDHTDAHIGLVLQVEGDPAKRGTVPYRVRWMDHSVTQRDWYGEEELVKL